MKDLYVEYDSMLGLVEAHDPRVQVSAPIEFGCGNEKPVVPERPVEGSGKVSGVQLHLQNFEKKEKKKQHFESCLNVQCKNGAKCVQSLDNNEAWCDCSESGYTGSFCQFGKKKKKNLKKYRKFFEKNFQNLANFSQNCDFIGRLIDDRSGIYKIDVDGSESLHPVFVKCQMEDEEGGWTVVENNFPNGTMVRGESVGKSSFWEIDYRGMDRSTLEHLIRNSAECRQFVKYECLNAPLE